MRLHRENPPVLNFTVEVTDSAQWTHSDLIEVAMGKALVLEWGTQSKVRT